MQLIFKNHKDKLHYPSRAEASSEGDRRHAGGKTCTGREGAGLPGPCQASGQARPPRKIAVTQVRNLLVRMESQTQRKAGLTQT